MTAYNIMLNDLLITQKVKFTIPVYQRPYSWNKEHCQKFVTDIESIIIHNESNHFLGTIIYISNDIISTATETKEYMIIDGQQRITTAILFIKAIYDLMEDGKDKELIFENTLVIDRFDKELKLKPIGKDLLALQFLINNNQAEIVNNSSKIINNYNEIKRMILASKDVSILQFLEGFRKLSIVEIILERNKDNPQIIFESINATGLDLRESDLIRNFILMDKELKEQEYLYKIYWSKIEDNVLNINISSFIRDYLTIKLYRIPKEKDVFKEFKLFSKKSNISLEELLKDLLNYSAYYKLILFKDTVNKKIEIQVLRHIRNLGYTVMYPVILQLYSEFRKELFSQDMFILILKILESFVVRRFITSKKSSELNKLFATLLKNTKNDINFTYDEYHIFIGYSLISYFPNDDEIKEQLISKDIYTRKTKFLKYFLGKLENQGSEETLLDDLQIEHIMPQKLTPQWRQELGANHKLIHSQYLHTLGNLTLTGYNQKYSNKYFSEKKKLIIENSSLTLNRYIINSNKWTELELLRRGEILILQVINLWNYPQVDIKTQNKRNQNQFTFADNIDVTNKKPKYFIFIGEKILVNNWRDFFIEYLILCHNLDSDIFENLTREPELEMRTWRVVSHKKEKVGASSEDIYELSENIFIRRSLETRLILKYSKIIFNKFGFEDNDFIFTLK